MRENFGNRDLDCGGFCSFMEGDVWFLVVKWGRK